MMGKESHLRMSNTFSFFLINQIDPIKKLNNSIKEINKLIFLNQSIDVIVYISPLISKIIKFIISYK